MPFIGGIFSFVLPSKAGIVGSLVLLLAVIMASYGLLIHQNSWFYRFAWLPDWELGFQVDQVSVVLIWLVCFISLMVHFFSLSYMNDDPGKGRYFLKLGFFTTAMLGILMSDHLILLFMFWELVGFSSYLLIGFWYQEINNAQAARIAFMTNRITDAGLLAGILLLLSAGGTGYISSIEMVDHPMGTFWIGTCMLMGILGKSAQFPFLTWLPQAMAGPTPVSALIHAATMVAAGVYLLFRIFVIFDPDLMLLVVLLGILTALIGAIAALNQTNLKRVLAYSTISQLGFMVMGLGVGAYDMAIFHLWTHAFFKAGLFLSIGSVIHYLSILEIGGDVQNMRHLGGLRKYLPVTFWAYVVGMLALIGLPFFTGFLSKEGILLGAFRWAEHGGHPVYYLVPFMAMFTTFLTACYMGRQLILVFLGSYRGPGVLKKQPFLWAENLPIGLLAILSLGVFYTLNPFHGKIPFLIFWLGTNQVESVNHPGDILIFSILLMLLGLGWVFWRYREVRLKKWISLNPSSLTHFAENAFYLDQIYMKTLVPAFNWIVVQTARVDEVLINPIIDRFAVFFVVLGKVINLIDKNLVDGGVQLISRLTEVAGDNLRKLQNARVQMHFVVALLGLLLLLLWLIQTS
jgi:NADH-quinone oxidoreductase subunit L|tara:strand:- start:12054 stop:13943 length:1890 start_codon:yes stop_codon:yes gene_type:complete